MQKQELIYVSGPLTAPTPDGEQDNLCNAMDVAAELVRRGHQPFVPHLSLHLHNYWVDQHGLTMPWEWWIDFDLRLLRGFDSLYRIKASKGADAEMFAAKALGLRIYTDLEQVAYTSTVLEALQEEYRDRGR